MKANGKKLGEVGFKYIGVPYSELDCQAFVESCLEDCGINKNLPGSNAWFREVMQNGWVGTPEECVSIYGEVPSGAFLFILQHDGKEPEKYKPDGIGNASHIGLCTGARGKGAIHSSASRGGVCESDFKGKTIKNGGWNRVGLWDQVDYGSKPTERATAVVYAENGLPVNLRKKPSLKAVLITRVPCGETVEILDHDGDWAKVRYNGLTGFMMGKFLSDGKQRTYCVIVHGLSFQDAEQIAIDYPNAEMQEERG